MKYDFTSILDRRGHDCAAYDGVGLHRIAPAKPKEGFDVIPMWVADMNFPVVPTVPEAIIKRANHPSFGYFLPTKQYYDAIIEWHEKRHGVTGLSKEHIGYENGVLGGMLTALDVLCSRGDKVLLNTPSYSAFITSLTKHGFNIVKSPLVTDEENVWRMDYEDMEKKIVENNIHAAVFCSPHNPCGRVWERWELEKVMEIFERHQVFLVADEIWSGIVRPGFQHIPTQSINDYAKYHTVAQYAPSKTFNLGGLVGSYHIIYDKWLRDRVDTQSALCYYNEMNLFSMHALIGAYSPEGYEWADELNQVIAGNADFACEHIKTHYKGIEVFKPQGTYMLFLDCTKWCQEHGKTIDELQKAGSDVGVAWQDGRLFCGDCHIRMNLASPLSRIQEAFARLDKYVFNV